MEEFSTTTEENAFYAFSLLEQLFPEQVKNLTVIVVSDSYHLLRCKLFFERYFSSVMLVPSQSNSWWRLGGAFREVGAVVKNLYLGRLSLHQLKDALLEELSLT
jgi:uncharacterized SAM-binding protein YcdF (DUF218 family)